MEGFHGPHKPLEAEEQKAGLPSEEDRRFHARVARATGGISPATVAVAYYDWLLHSLAYPDRQQRLAANALAKGAAFAQYLQARLSGTECAKCIEPEDKDNRFSDERWQDMPFDFYAQSFLLAQDWWKQATGELHGLSRHHQDVVSFVTRQWLDMLSPSNFPFTNPSVIETTLRTGGGNFVQGARNFMEDVRRFNENEPPRGTERFRVGEDVATAEGRVVYRNELMELIQYAPKTSKVYPEPVLLIPAWIMKYYILDLSPENSMVNYLVEQGHTVFMISWKNPGREDADHGMEDYLEQGVMAALEAISAIVPEQKIHATGYCIGGTLLAAAAALMGRKGDDWLQTLTLFTAQTDFEEAGELMLFVDESELAYLEDLMWDQGYLKKHQISGAFWMLRSKDLIWSRIVEQYLKGGEEEMFDLMAWNTDATRLPYKVHADYLRRFYLNNDLAEGRYELEGAPVSLRDIKTPVFTVATEKDHIAPWHSVYRLHQLLDTELTFVLTNGGHNAGIISEPGHEGRQFLAHTHKPGDRYLPPDQWRLKAGEKKGSWWPAWQQWLVNHSGERAAAPKMGAPSKGYKPLADAPGTYVRER